MLGNLPIRSGDSFLADEIIPPAQCIRPGHRKIVRVSPDNVFIDLFQNQFQNLLRPT
jgi:hypothetical protein